MQTVNDWHYDIQHIKAQTAFIRAACKKKQIVVAYLENDQKSWPAWKTKHPNYLNCVTHLIDSIGSIYQGSEIHLNGHSGGGSFVFAYLKAVDQIPNKICRISFLDSDYNYDSSYQNKLLDWLQNKQHQLRVFAYNDSIALYNGKPVVSPTGGTWYRSKLMLANLKSHFHFKDRSNDSMLIYKSSHDQIQFFLKTNPDRKILHTNQVALNGFIHSELSGTKMDSNNYLYFSKRAYEQYIKD
jgi:poly(3-hydroxyalkanoate) synthetase